ncbi:hypothetical protein BGZ73_001880 [Actinomortierella ambigua]|nr:hypothetical protein BGZ73_001880 [Actinomortierella ambigua]
MPAPAAPGLQSIADLTTTSRVTTGAIPPPLVGATMTIVDDKLYLFGGRLISTRQMTNSVYVLNLVDFEWQNITDIVNVAATQSIGDPGAEDENERAKPPQERYFHSANAYKNMIVFFGGMGPTSGASTGQDLVVFDDINVLDLELLQWRQIRIPSSNHAPKPRYAHLSSISGNKLVVIGGQDIANQYIEEINVLDLDSWQWVASMPFEKHCGSYRSIAVSGSGQGSTIPIIGSELEQASSDRLSPSQDGFPTSYLRKTPSNTSLHYTPSLRKSSSNLALKKGGPLARLSGSGPPGGNPDARSSIYRLSHLMTPTPVQQEEHPIYLYSNFNFTDVKRELQVLNPPNFQIQDHSTSMSGTALPPGLRFPTGAISGQHLLLSGTYLTSNQQTFSIWSLNLSSLVWTRIDTGTVFNTGSWNRGLLLENSNAYLVFGNKNRNLADDYQNRQTNFDHVSIVDLEAFGIYRHPPTTMTQTAQELGLSLLNDASMADFEILTQDNQRIAVNSGILAARWPYFAVLLREQEELDAAEAANKQESDSEGGLDESLLHSKRTLTLPEPYTVVLAFLQYLYTDHLVTAQQHQAQVLSQLLLLADMYGLDRLRDLATHALHQMLNMTTAAMVYETAALSQQTGLQIRSLKVMIAAKKMLQQQQLKLQQQQSHSQSISAGHAWRSAEPNPYEEQHNSNNSFGYGQSAPLAHFQPSPPPPLSPSSMLSPTSPDYRSSIYGTPHQTALPHPVVRNRGSIQGLMPSQHWNTEPLTPPPASPPPTATPVAPAATKSSFFSFGGKKNQQPTTAPPSTAPPPVSKTSSSKVPTFAMMGGIAVTSPIIADTASVKSGKSGGSGKDASSADIQRLLAKGSGGTFSTAAMGK